MIARFYISKMLPFLLCAPVLEDFHNTWYNRIHRVANHINQHIGMIFGDCLAKRFDHPSFNIEEITPDITFPLKSSIAMSDVDDDTQRRNVESETLVLIPAMISLTVLSMPALSNCNTQTDRVQQQLRKLQPGCFQSL